MAVQPWLKSYSKRIRWDMDIPVKPLYSLLDDAVARFPGNLAIDFLDKTYTYSEVGCLVRHAAAGFQKLGVGKGIKVGLFLPNCPQFVIAYYGILKAGGTVVNFSPLYSEEELLKQVEDSETDFMVTLSLTALYPKIAGVLRRSRIKQLIVGTLQEALPFPKNWLFPLLKGKDIAKVPSDAKHVSFKSLLANDGGYKPVSFNLKEDIAVLQYTGGTTGVSKGAMLTHANLYANTQQAVAWFPDVEFGKERMMGVLPFFHVFAMTAVMNFSIATGAAIIMRPRFELEPVLNDIAKKKPTMMPGVPTMYTAINNYPKLSQFDLTSIKMCLSGGAPLPLAVKQRFEALAGCKLVEGYGLTETSPVACCNPIEGANKEKSIGIPLPGTTVTIVDRDDPEKLMPLGEAGEICISGPQVMKGYWRNPEASASTFTNGMLRTGDVGFMDDEGYIFIIDRKKDLILVGGFNVYPRTVEEAIYRHLAVAEVTVIGIPDEYAGEAVKAFVKLKEGAQSTQTTADQLREFLRDKLGKHEMPKHIEFRKELPKTMIGKLSKKELVAEEKAKAAGKGGGDARS
ncbi:MAG: long-chain fatty acid--CoA ligase [Alphaproteobacteria bacterium]|nr:long-chain fatty acid--CoA ligase [Alphaproteobacteria bacterium]